MARQMIKIDGSILKLRHLTQICTWAVDTHTLSFFVPEVWFDAEVEYPLL